MFAGATAQSCERMRSASAPHRLRTVTLRYLSPAWTIRAVGEKEVRSFVASSAAPTSLDQVRLVLSVVFATFGKGRDMADCGTRAGWSFDGQRFRLSFYAAQHRCDGPPGDWPVLFRTAEHPGRRGHAQRCRRSPVVAPAVHGDVVGDRTSVFLMMSVRQRGADGTRSRRRRVRQRPLRII